MTKSQFINQVQNANGYISQAIGILEELRPNLCEGFHDEEILDDIENLIADLQSAEYQAENIAPHCE